jgi:hypothetical protein
MDQNIAFQNNRQAFEDNMHDFIHIEIETSITFATAALQSNDPVRTRQDTINARKGYETACRYISEAQQRFPERPISPAATKGIQQLKGMLQRLGEQV